MIQLRQEQLVEINRQAESQYPYECCGLLLGILGEERRRKTLTMILSVSNARDEENQHNRFLITPEDLMRGELLARKHQLAVVGFYHSHPDHPAVPSAYDLEHAWPVYSYLIVAVAKGVAGQVASWELTADRSRFEQESICKGD